MLHTDELEPGKNQYCEDLDSRNPFKQGSAAENDIDYDSEQSNQVEAVNCREGSDSEDTGQLLTERWSPLGANFDEFAAPSGLPSPVSELELLGSDGKQKELHSEGLFRQKYVEEEKELLMSSLMALTSHFAHVQLRVRQIVDAPTHERDQLLKDLDDLAFRGIPEPISAFSESSKSCSPVMLQNDEELTRQHQLELIEHLKAKLSDVENFVYDSGAPVLPQHVLLEKQKIIIDELKNKLNLKVDDQDLPKLNSEELKHQVDNALGELVGPLKMKEQLVTQLKTQITDLERFIAYLQCDSDDSKTLNSSQTPSEVYNSYSAKKKTSLAAVKKATDDCRDITSLQRGKPQLSCSDSMNNKTLGLVDRASILMQMLTSSHFAPNAAFQKNTLKKTTKGNHWGDLRAQLEVDIQEVASLAATLCYDKKKLANIKKSLKKASLASHESNADSNERQRLQLNPSQCNRSKHRYVVSSDSDDEYNCIHWEKQCRRIAHNTKRGDDSISLISKELNSAVRKSFSVTLQHLIQHGLRANTESTATSTLIVPFMRCFNLSPIGGAAADRERREEPPFMSSSAAACHDTDIDNGSFGFFGTRKSPQMHAWELLLQYYYLKQGDEYNNTPARKLSESFNLNITGSSRVSPKQSLLSTIGMIISMHKPYKRSLNAHFKAFVCAALNMHQLVEWLNLIFSCTDLIDSYYSPSSYVACTGFRDSLNSIDALTKYDFDLPVDLAVRHFRNI